MSGRNTPFGRVERMISMRYLRARKEHGGVGFIALISFLCIMLAIAAMIIIMSIMNGFRSDMIRLTIGSEGHIYVATAQTEPTREQVDAVEAMLRPIPGVETAFQFTQHYTGVQANNEFALAQVIGISPEDLLGFDLIREGVIQGDLAQLGQGRGSEQRVAIGSNMAVGLGLQVGDILTIYSPRTRQTISGAVPVRKAYTVGAVFSTGLFVTDQTYIYMALDEAEILFADGATSGEIQMRLVDPDEIDAMSEAVFDRAEAEGRPVYLSTWRDRNASTAGALRIEQIAMRLIFMIVVVIAAFPVLASMIMLVKNKSRDIAILRTIGTSRSGILRIFLMSGATVGILGTLAGLVLGIVFCLNLYPIQLGIERLLGIQLFPPDVYQLTDRIPVKIVWSEVTSVALWGFLISALAVFWPAWQASKIDPVEALRYE